MSARLKRESPQRGRHNNRLRRSRCTRCCSTCPPPHPNQVLPSADTKDWPIIQLKAEPILKPTWHAQLIKRVLLLVAASTISQHEACRVHKQEISPHDQPTRGSQVALKGDLPTRSANKRLAGCINRRPPHTLSPAAPPQPALPAAPASRPEAQPCHHKQLHMQPLYS